MKKFILTLFPALAFFGGHSQCNDLFISEYIEGTSFNKAIEIYNPTSFNIPLTGLFAVRIYANGSATPTSTIALTGTINANSTYVLAHTSANATILGVANQTNGGLTFNGNDAVELYNTFNGTSSDVIGVIGFDPGSEWLVGGVSGTQDHTLIRMSSVQAGTTTWTGVGENQWNVMPTDDASNLGAHTMTPCSLPEPTATASSTDTCLGLPTYFYSSVTGGTPGYSYFWDFGDGSPVDNSPSPTHVYTSPGSYTATLIVVDQNLQDDTVYVVLTVFDYANSVFATAGATSNGCAPDTIMFTNGSSNAVSYLWDFGDATTSTLMSPPNKIYPAGVYTVTLVAMGMGGCNDTSSTVITVDPAPNVNILSGDSTICNTSFGMFIYATDTSGTWSGANVFDYGGGQGFFSSGAITPGVYYAVFTVSNACGTAKDSMAITVANQPIANYTYALTGGGFTVNFTNTSSGGASSYYWDFDGQGSSTQVNPSMTFPAGSYNVCLYAYDSTLACEAIACQTISIVGMEEISKPVFRVYPNPTGGIVNLVWPNAQAGWLRIQDIAGRIVYEKYMQVSGTVSVDLSFLGNGIYQAGWITTEGVYYNALEINR